MTILNGVIPVFLVVLVGALARRLGWMDAPFARQLNRVIFYVAVPALLIRVLGEERAGNLSLEVAAAVTVATIGAALAGVIIARLFRVPRDRFGVIVQAASRGNLVFMAFPVIYAAGGEPALRVAALLAALLIPVQNIIAVAALGASTGHRGRRLLQIVVLNPIVLGVVAGVLWGLADIDAPEWVDVFLRLLGSIAMPGALLAVGAQLELRQLEGRVREVSAVALVKLALCPAIGFAVLAAFGVGGTESLVAMLLLAAPTAVASTVVAQELGGDVEYAGAIVLASTLGAFPAFIIWGLLA